LDVLDVEAPLEFFPLLAVEAFIFNELTYSLACRVVKWFGAPQRVVAVEDDAAIHMSAPVSFAHRNAQLGGEHWGKSPDGDRDAAESARRSPAAQAASRSRRHGAASRLREARAHGRCCSRRRDSHTASRSLVRRATS